jgi:Ca-activated chloride channel family protein
MTFSWKSPRRTRGIVAAALLIVSPILGDGIATPAATAAGPSAAQERKSGTIRVQTNYVSIVASVLAPDGHPIPDLPMDAFEVLEEGVPQQIDHFEAETNQPLDLALMVDTSLSTYKELKFEGESAARFAKQLVRPGDKLAVFQFSDEVVQLSEFSDDVAVLQSAAHRLTAGAGTELYDAVLLGSRALQHLPPGRRRVIVLVTDAGETTSHANFEDTRRAAIASEALIYSIVIRPIPNESGRNTAGEHALITITDSVGGAMYYLDSFDQLQAMFDRIDHELRTQYLLGYYPRPAPPPGTYRHIELRVKGGGTLHYRKEYLTAKNPK